MLVIETRVGLMLVIVTEVSNVGSRDRACELSVCNDRRPV